MRQAQIKAYVTLDEKTEVTALATQVRITTSELVRRMVLGHKLPDTRRHEAVIGLCRINADQARLGNLLRLVLMPDNDVEDKKATTVDLDKLYEDIRDTQALLREKVKALSP